MRRKPDSGPVTAPTNRSLRRALGRAAATSTAGAVLAVGGLVGGGVAAASEPVVIGTCTEDVNSDSFGQRIVAAPNALDAKVEQAAMLVFPFQSDRIKRIRQQFLESAPVELGTVTERDQNFSGSRLAEALAPRIAAIPEVGDKGDAMNFHVGNLALLTCFGGVTVPGQQKPEPSETPTSTEPPPPEPEPSESPSPEQPPSETPNDENGPPPPENTEEPGGNDPTETTPDHAPAPAERVDPSDYAYVPGSLPPWSDTRFGAAPGDRAETGDLLSEQRHDQQNRVREAGSAEALPSETGDRVALPVLLAAISLAGVTSALIRTWVLRRG